MLGRLSVPILLCHLLVVLSALPALGNADTAQRGKAVPVAATRTFVDETLDYDIAFLWFDRLAAGQLRFEATAVPGQFRATLEARTLGVAGWLTSDRVQNYTTLMESVPGGGFRPLSHDSHVVKGKGAKRVSRDTSYIFDYRHKVVHLERKNEGRVLSVEKLPMDDGIVPNDFLTAFFNFRLGVFGELHEGKRFTIPTMTRKGRSDILVEILPAGERPAKVLFPPGGMLARAVLDPEILDTGGGSVYAWFDGHGRPARAVVENILGMGDVRGTLR